ncbi:MAG: hypothetical protein ABI570_03210 [Ilumatobacteraceae bacterium]
MKALAFLVVAGIACSSCSSSDSSATQDTSVFGIADLSLVALNRLQPGEEESIQALGATGAGPPIGHVGHSHDTVAAEITLTGTIETEFNEQWVAAQASVSEYDTLEKIKALGFVQASGPVAGIATHWTHWSQIAKPFDPTKPSMVLFDETRTPPVLVGYSYALQARDYPDGFAGPNDIWHQHAGICVNNGWVVREMSEGPSSCDGTFIAGGDFWMLHAWVVPGWENRVGKFAPFNPKLCPRDEGTPDYARCDG